MCAGTVIDISIQTQFITDVCQPPAIIDFTVNDNNNDMKLVFDLKYTADGSEGSTLTTIANGNIPEINGKKILLLTREFAPLYKVDTNPNTTEFTWDNNDIGLGFPTAAGERFLILYRTY